MAEAVELHKLIAMQPSKKRTAWMCSACGWSTTALLVESEALEHFIEYHHGNMREERQKLGLCMDCGSSSHVTCSRPNADDPVNHPSHYTAHPSGVECITITEHMSFCLGNAVKYIWRADEKGDAIQDLEKAKWYVEREIKRRKKKTT